MFLILAAVLGSVHLSAGVRTFTVYNACPFTIWPAIWTNMSDGNAVPEQATGWIATAYSSASFSVPDYWTAGRIWGRRDCTFTGANTSSTCIDGGCNGGLICDAYTGTGAPPNTLAQWSLGASQDYYSVSLVEGYNLPMRITPSAACPIAECPWDLGPACPSQLVGPYDTNNYPVGCKSACVANLDGTPNNSSNCCTGYYDTPATCSANEVAYYWFFKGKCPRAYAYPFDEPSGTALWTCPASSASNYTLTFCPPNNGSSSASSSSTTTYIPVSVPTTAGVVLTSTTTITSLSQSTASQANNPSSDILYPSLTESLASQASQAALTESLASLASVASVSLASQVSVASASVVSEASAASVSVFGAKTTSGVSSSATPSVKTSRASRRCQLPTIYLIIFQSQQAVIPLLRHTFGQFWNIPA